MYIGGLEITKRPCKCNAHFAETFVDNDGNIGVIIWNDVTETSENAVMLYNSEPDATMMDDLNMVCTRCGLNVVGM